MNSDTTDTIGELLRLTGPRPAVSAERTARVKEAVRAEWRAAVAEGRDPIAAGGKRAAPIRLLALAAMLLAVVAIPLVRGWRPFPSPARPLARVEIGSNRLPAGTSLSSGAILETGGGERLALRLPSGHSLRLDAGSRARLVSGGVVDLLGGALYLDSGDRSGPAGGRPAVDIRTPAGTVHEIGTQFEVRLLDAAVRVRVREGAVAIRRRAGGTEVREGRELVLDPGGSAREGPLLDPEAAWRWAGEAAPMMAIDGRTLGEFLAWYARERGLSIRYADADLAASVPAIRLSGSIEGMRLDEALSSVLSVSGLSHRIDGAILSVERPSSAQ
jgi:ferric-dicitrate binding protein FerR (iron transport regulator)